MARENLPTYSYIVQLNTIVRTDTNETNYIQGLSGNYRVIPVTFFLITLYNASFMFDTNKSTNLLVTALQWFDLKSTVGDEVFLNTMSKSITSASFSN